MNNDSPPRIVIRTYDDIFSYIVSDWQKIDVLEAITLRIVDITLKEAYARRQENGEVISQEKKDDIIYSIYNTKKIDEQKTAAQSLLLEFISRASHQPIMGVLSSIQLELYEISQNTSLSKEDKKITFKALCHSTLEHGIGAFVTAFFFIVLAKLLPYLSPIFSEIIKKLTDIINDLIK